MEVSVFAKQNKTKENMWTNYITTNFQKTFQKLFIYMNIYLILKIINTPGKAFCKDIVSSIIQLH